MKSLLTTDSRDAWRSLRATPIVTTVAVLSLALGIGANTALFSILLEQPRAESLPVHDPQQLALLQKRLYQSHLSHARHARSVDGAFALEQRALRPRRAWPEPSCGRVAWFSGPVSTSSAPARGRGLTRAERRVRGGGQHGRSRDLATAWQRRLGGAARRHRPPDPQSIAIPFTIAGVMPEGFFGPDVGRSVDVVIPLGAEPSGPGSNRSRSAIDWWLAIMFRLHRASPSTSPQRDSGASSPQISAATLPSSAALSAGALPEGALHVVAGSTGQSFLRQRYVRPSRRLS